MNETILELQEMVRAVDKWQERIKASLRQPDRFVVAFTFGPDDLGYDEQHLTLTTDRTVLSIARDAIEAVQFMDPQAYRVVLKGHEPAFLDIFPDEYPERGSELYASVHEPPQP